MRKFGSAILVASCLAAGRMLGSHVACAADFGIATAKLPGHTKECIVVGVMKSDDFFNFGNGAYVPTAPIPDDEIAKMGFDCKVVATGSPVPTVTSLQNLTSSVFGPIAAGVLGNISPALSIALPPLNNLYNASNAAPSWMANWGHCGEVRRGTPGVRELTNRWVYVGESDGKKYILCQSSDGQNFSPAQVTQFAEVNAPSAASASPAASTPAPVATPAPAPVAQASASTPAAQGSAGSIGAPVSLLPTGGLNPEAPSVPAPDAPKRPTASISYSIAPGSERTMSFADFCRAVPAGPGCGSGH